MIRSKFEQAKNNLARAIKFSTGDYLLSPSVISLMVLQSIMLHLLASGSTVTGNLGIRALCAALAMFPHFGTIFIVKQFTSRFIPKYRSLILILTFFIAGAFRGIALSTAFFALHMSKTFDLGFRLPASTVSFGLATVATTFVVAAVEENRKAIEQLEDENQRLLEAVKTLNSETDERQDANLEEVRRSIFQDLEEIDRSSAQAAADDIKQLVNEFVRPLSHQLAQQIPQWSPVLPDFKRVTLLSSLSSVDPRRHFGPVLITLIVALPSLSSSFYFFSTTQAWQMFITSVILLPLSVIFWQRIFRKFYENRATYTKIILFSFELELIALPITLSSVIILKNSDNPYFYLTNWSIGLPIFAWMTTLGNAALERTGFTQLELVATNNLLRWNIARVNLNQWFQKGTLSRYLHGPIQGALQASVIRMNNRNLEKIEIANVLNDIRERINNISKDEAPGILKISIVDFLSNLQSTWNGICQINYTIAEDEIRALETDLSCTGILCDVIQESCTNAIRHGGANKIDLLIKQVANNEFMVEVDNNGKGIDVTASTGLGSKFFDSCCIRWERAKVASGTHFSALLPYFDSAKTIGASGRD